MARAMPVISSSRPSTTNIGTASSSMEDMPWSIWPMMVGERDGAGEMDDRPMVAMAKLKAIGTPRKMHEAHNTG